ncbi:MAG: LysR family transcriptional regulator [Actinomycetota bacterium]|nr:LysR family transcriptional regulator [Actinomycetota bacterium]
MRPDANVSVDDLRYLVAVARAGKLVTAADAMRVDHTTVRRRIDRLETALGVRLIDRGADGWMLTAVGREVVARSAGLDDVVQAVRAAAAGESDTRVRGTVRVLTPDGFGTVFAAPALARLAAQHPDLQVELVTSTRPLTSHGAGFDVAVTVGAVANSRLATEVLTAYALRLYASQDYLDAHPRIRSLDDLRTHGLVFYVDALLTVRELELGSLLEGMHVGFGCTNVFAQLAAVKAGAGVGLLHAFMAEPDAGLVRILPEVDVQLPFSLSVRRAAPLTDATALVCDALRAEVSSRAMELLPA